MGRKVLDDLIAKREMAVTKAEGVLERSLDEDRVGQELTDAESTELTGLRSRIESLDKSIGEWTKIIETEEKVTEARGRLGVQAPEVKAGGALVTREEAVYRVDGERSFFGDLWHARQGSSTAREFLDRHTRAMTTNPAAGGGGNIVPPQYLASLFAPQAKYGAPIASTLPRYPLTDARPFQIPRQLTATTVANQASENTNVAASDVTFDQITVTPVTKAGSTVFSRQLLDGSLPAIDQIIANDLRGELLQEIEKMTVVALLATAGAITDTTSGQGDEILDGIVENVPKVYSQRLAPADAIFVNPAEYSSLALAKDSTGRYLLSVVQSTAENAAGLTSSLATMTSQIGGLPVVASPALTALKVVVARTADMGLFLSPALEFRYEEKGGPSSIEIGVWQYVAVVTSRYPKGVAIITHTVA